MIGAGSGCSRGRHRTRLLTSALLALGASACTSLFAERQSEAVEDIGARLVAAAETRSNLSSMRVWVYEIHETSPDPAPRQFGLGPHGDDEIGLALEHDFSIALSSYLNLIETEAFAAPVAPASSASLDEQAAAHGATHLLLGDYLRRDDELIVSVRLVAADSRLIVAAARGIVPLEELGDLVPDAYQDGGTGLPARYPGRH